MSYTRDQLKDEIIKQWEAAGGDSMPEARKDKLVNQWLKMHKDAKESIVTEEAIEHLLKKFSPFSFWILLLGGILLYKSPQYQEGGFGLFMGIFLFLCAGWFLVYSFGPFTERLWQLWVKRNERKPG